MKEIKLRTKTLLVNEHIDELTIERHNLANEYALLDSEIGNTPADMARHLAKIDFHIAQKNWDGIVGERRNLFRNFYHLINHDNFVGLQFACLIESIDDRKVYDFSHEGMKRLLVELSKDGLTMGLVRLETEDVKKKSSQNFKSRFQSVLIGLRNLTKGNR